MPGLNSQNFRKGAAVGVPPVGESTLGVASDGSYYSLDSSGNVSSIGGGGAGWVATTAIPFARSILGANAIKSQDALEFIRAGEVSLGGATPPAFVTSEDGGVYKFAGVGLMSFNGSQVVLASPTATSWIVMSRFKLVGTPGAGDQQLWCALNDGSNNNRIGIELNGPTSITVPSIRFDKATVITRGTGFNAAGTIGSGIAIGAYVDLAIAFTVASGLVSAYVNGTLVGTRNDLASAGPTVGMMPWWETTASTTEWRLATAYYATTGP